MKFVSNARYSEPVESGTIYRGKIGKLNISVHRIVHCEGWYLSCTELGISRMHLKNDIFMDAVEEAKEILRKKVEGFCNDINTFCKENIEISRY